MLRNPYILILVVFFFFVSAIASAQKKPLTNEDVVKMVKGNLPGEIIIEAIKSSEQKFDVSADGLIALKQEGVPDPVIQAMVARTNPNKTNDPNDVNTINANVRLEGTVREVILVDGTSRVQMKYTFPTGSRTGGVGMKMINPFGKVKALATFSGNQATLRTSNTSPVFESWLLADVNPSDAIILVKLKAKSDRREISTASGRIGISAGYSKDDIIPITLSEIQTNTTGVSPQKLYKASPVNPLSQGEYALVIQRTAYYDFGIDPAK